MKTQAISNLQREDSVVREQLEAGSPLGVRTSTRASTANRFHVGVTAQSFFSCSQADWFTLTSLLEAGHAIPSGVDAKGVAVAAPVTNEGVEISTLRTDAGDVSIELKVTAGEFSGTMVSFTRCNDTGGISIDIVVPPSQLDGITRQMPAIRAALERRGLCGSSVRIRMQGS